MPDLRWRRLVPGVEVALGYRKEMIGRDLLAGAVLAALLVPAGIGYAQASGLPPQAGLLATIVPMLVYAVVGPSRILVLAPDSALAPIIAAAVTPLAQGSPSRATALGGLLAVMVGLVLLAGGLARFGRATDLLSKPIRVGYLNGIAVVVIISQLPALCGFSVVAEASPAAVSDFVAGLRSGLLVPAALVFGLAALVVIVVARMLRRGATGVLAAVVCSLVVSAAAGLDGTIPMAGALPRGLPTPGVHGLTWADVGSLVGPALGIALIAFADTSVLSRSFAARRGEVVDGSHEMAATGVANAVGGLFGGFPVSASSSRTPVLENAGARSQLSGVVAALLVLVFCLATPDLTAYLPRATLAAVVIVAAGGLVDVPGLVRLLRMDLLEGLLAVAAFVGVVAIGVLQGIVVAIALSLVAFVVQAWRPYRTELGLLRGVRGYHDLTRHPEGSRLPGVAIVRFDAPLFFANGAIFRQHVLDVVAAGTDVRTVVLAAEPITDIDTTAADELVTLDDVLRSRGITLIVAEMKGPAKDRLRRYGLGERFGPERFAPTVGAAVDAATGTWRGDITPPA